MSLGREKFEQRFYGKLRSTETGCWEWQGARSPEGYGKCKYFGQQLAHRVSYIFHHKVELTPEICVCHKCDNPCCVNPSHLFLGSLGDNNKDRHAKGRTVIHSSSKTQCSNGHEYTLENTYYRPNGARNCRECARIRARNNHAKKRKV